MMETATAKGEKVTAYSGNVRPAFVITGVIIIMHIIVAAILFNEINIEFWLINALLFVLYTLLFGVMVFQATQITITIYENGIDWQRSSSHLFTTWDNIDRIGRNNEGDSTTYGLHLREQVQPEVNSWLDRRLYAAPVDYIRLTPTIIVPTTLRGVKGNVIDMQAFAATPFGQNILRYTPHLLEKNGS